MMECRLSLSVCRMSVYDMKKYFWLFEDSDSFLQTVSHLD